MSSDESTELSDDMSGGYRERCLEQKGDECIECGADEAIEVHHLDGDRFINPREKLVADGGRSVHTDTEQSDEVSR